MNHMELKGVWDFLQECDRPYEMKWEFGTPDKEKWKSGRPDEEIWKFGNSILQKAKKHVDKVWKDLSLPFVAD